MKYFLSFVEEYWPGQIPKYMCRIEVYEKPEKSPYATEEIHFCTDREDDYYDFRNKWDWKTVSKKKLGRVRKEAGAFEREWLNNNT